MGKEDYITEVKSDFREMGDLTDDQVDAYFEEQKVVDLLERKYSTYKKYYGTDRNYGHVTPASVASCLWMMY